PSRIQRPVHCDSGSPGSRLRVPAITRKCPEALHPHPLRDVGGQLGITTEPANDSVDMRRMLRPKPLHRPLVASYRTLEVELIEWHLGRLISHAICSRSFLEKNR